MTDLVVIALFAAALVLVGIEALVEWVSEGEDEH